MNKETLKTIVTAAVCVARADDQVVMMEQELLEAFASRLEMNESEVAALHDAQISPMEAVNRMPDEESKAFLVKTLCAIAYSDGNRHESEIALIQATNEALNPPLELKPWEDWEDYIEEIVEMLQNQSD